jgi:hypothetical protein
MLWNSVSFTGFFGIFIPAPVASGARSAAASDAGAEAFRFGNILFDLQNASTPPVLLLKRRVPISTEMGCGASSSVIEYAQVAPGGPGGRRSSADGDEVEAFPTRPQLPTPVMDRIWVVHQQAMTTSCIKEFMGLLGLKAKDMQGGMRVFAKLTKASGIELAKLADLLRMPAGASSPLAMCFFKAVASTSADGTAQGLTYRTFMFFLAMFKHGPLAQPEKLRFWYNIMMLATDPQVVATHC